MSRKLRRIAIGSSLGLALLATLVAGGWSLARPTRPDVFYAAPASFPAEPGRLLRKASFERQVPAGVQGWRILYTTTDARGAPALASALVLASRSAVAGERPVVAWAHGTTGIVPGCAPSVIARPFAYVPGLSQLLERGWVFVATDYTGLATAGPHPYLIGEGEARSTLDAIRAARQMQELQLGKLTVVWGHSQGGHAALWTGILAPTYAPEVTLAGVAAAAPATDLVALVERTQHTTVGRVMTSFVLKGYADAYPDVSFEAYARSTVAQLVAQDVAGRCLGRGPVLFSALQSLTLGGSIFGVSPTTGSLAARLAQNTPDRALSQPVLIAQGMSDDLVLPDIQSRWVHRRCEQGQAIEFIRYQGRNHLSLVAGDSPFSTDLLAWTEARFAGQPAPPGCTFKTHQP